jgi:Flp pilus assembly protein TadG
MRNSFWKNKDGNVAVMFGIVLVPIVTCMGVAVDYSRANSARTAMQSALDGAGLMISKDAAGLSAAEISTRADAYFKALVNRPELSNITVSATYTPNSSSGATLQMSSTGTIATDFMRVAGFPTMNLSTTSTTTWGNTRLRVALALDSTGSMDKDDKMEAMQAAAKKLIDQLSTNAKSPGDVYISMIPFSTHVNVGKANYGQTWLDWNDWEEVNGDCNINSGDKSRTRCGQKGGTWKPDSHTTWDGCVTDRDEDYDVKKTPPVTSNASTLFQAEQFAECPVQLVPMTYDWTTLKTRIGQMSPGGPTNQPVGMAWAWLSLMPTAPLNAPAEDSNSQYKKIIIVLSDGLNTKNKKAGNGSDPSSYVDARQKLLCDNIKADGITVYAIQVNTDKDPEAATLKYCASGSANFYMLTSASQIMSAFDNIGAQLSKLRIAK